MSEPILAEAIGTIDGVNDEFQTPSPYFAGTLFAYLNGQLLAQDDDDGPIELGTNQVRMRIAPRDGDVLHFYYDTKPPVGGGFYAPPRLMAALHLVPVTSILKLEPVVVDTEEVVDIEHPDTYSARGLAPITKTLNLVPRIISAEEE